MKAHLISSFQRAYRMERWTFFTKSRCNTLYWKKNKDERYIQNWWPIPLLKIDTRFLLKDFVERLKSVFLFSFPLNQTAQVKDKFISKDRGLISDKLQNYGYFKIKRLVSCSLYSKSIWFCQSSFLIFCTWKIWFWWRHYKQGKSSTKISIDIWNGWS